MGVRAHVGDGALDTVVAAGDIQHVDLDIDSEYVGVLRARKVLERVIRATRPGPDAVRDRRSADFVECLDDVQRLVAGPGYIRRLLNREVRVLTVRTYGSMDNDKDAGVVLQAHPVAGIRGGSEVHRRDALADVHHLNQSFCCGHIRLLLVKSHHPRRGGAVVSQSIRS